MKTNKTPRKGIALVIVLAMLVLLSGLLVAFLTTATSERNSTAANAASVSARQIADNTVNLVINQVREATNAGDPNGNGGTTTWEDATWASQPGAIRVLSGQLGGGKFSRPDRSSYSYFSTGGHDRIYKLFSTDEMVSAGTADQTAPFLDDVAVIESWDPSKENDPEYVDINEPLLSKRLDIDSSGEVVDAHYPIIDPRAMFTTDPKTGRDTAAFPLGPAPGSVDGFDAKITPDRKLKLPGSPISGGTGVAVPYLPMPVKWLYVLRDGTMLTAKELKGREGLDTNPIVGRTAFWTDDETCKLNINTASEGSFWDVPVVSTKQESGIIDSSNQLVSTAPVNTLALGAAQPTKNEYPRYPGHPAQTCLSPVLGWLWGINWTTSAYPMAKGTNGTFANQLFREAIYKVVPFMPNYNAPKTDGGLNTSYGGTRRVDPDFITQDGARSIETKHLYASVDDLIFQNKLGNSQTKDTNQPEINSLVAAQALEKGRFFLTATSRAPDLNVFGRPRVTIWPTNARKEMHTQFDDLFEFASNVYREAGKDGKNYGIYRVNPYSATQDFNKLRSGYVQGTTQEDDHNQKLFEYIQFLTNKQFPGYGGSFAQKYTTPERDEILTQMFDYVRTINLVDTGTASQTGNQFVPFTPRFFPPGTRETNDSGGYIKVARSMDWSGQITPLRTDPSTAAGDYQGQGRFATISEAGLIFYRYNAIPPGQAAAVPCLQAVLALEFATTTPGFAAYRQTFYTRVRAVRDTQVKMGNSAFIQMGFSPKRLINIPNVAFHETCQGRAYMPILGFNFSMQYYTENRAPMQPHLYANPFTQDPGRENNNTILRKTFTNANPTSINYLRGNTVRYYPYVSNPIPIGGNAGFSFKGGAFEVEIWSGEAPDDNNRVADPGGDTPPDPKNTKGLVQVVQIDFPQDEVPRQSGGTTAVQFPMPGQSGKGTGDFGTRFNGSNEDGGRDTIDNTNDVSRSVEAIGISDPYITESRPLDQKGDIRLMAARRLVEPSFFRPRDGGKPTDPYFTTTRNIHGFTHAHGDPVAGNTGQGKLGANSNPRTSKPAIIPRNINGVKRSDNGPGDWDKGLSKHMDAAGINKVDEGNIKWEANDGSIYARIPYYRGRAIEEVGQTNFSPNRMLSSPVMFGSIPAGVVRGRPWETLLFRPDREATGSGHPGSQTPPDYLWVDLFHMPIVEPYAISEPMSTAGRVNLNYIIAPFGYAKSAGGNINGMSVQRSYLRRDTALRGALKSVCMMAVNTNAPDGGHVENPADDQNQVYRSELNLNKTIEIMEQRLRDPKGSLFRTPAEICSIDLYPKDSPFAPVSDWATFWNTTYDMTGDNMRERPYSLIYPRVTTKSNTYTVHMWCQTIRKSPKSKANEFDPRKDQVSGEYRGSATFERYIDPNDVQLKNYNEQTERLDRYYRYRVINTKHFSPK